MATRVRPAPAEPADQDRQMTGRAPAAGVLARGPRPLRITREEFGWLAALVRQETGIALGDHKRELVCSRLGKRLRHHGYATFSQYREHLATHDPDGLELLRMVNAITTNKTEFFRDERHFTILRAMLLQPQAGGRVAPRSLRLWSAGCSSGEEPYSIALTVLDALGTAGAQDVRILASDINTEMLARVERGVYAADQAARVPAALREACFVSAGSDAPGTVEVAPQLRALVTVRRINLTGVWPIRAPLDAIFCRNVLIYFDRALQQRCVGRFVELLKPGGYLFLGGSESLLGLRPELENLGNCVYRRAGR
jgi:chemotaxis protein methyltransferase CheR